MIFFLLSLPEISSRVPPEATCKESSNNLSGRSGNFSFLHRAAQRALEVSLQQTCHSSSLRTRQPLLLAMSL